MALSVRETIVREVLERLKRAFPSMYVERGFSGTEVSKFPSLYLFEGTETREVSPNRKNIYTVTLPIHIEYFTKRRTIEDGLEDLDDVFQNMIAVIEVGDTFMEGLPVFSYELVENDRVRHMDNVMNLTCEWNFKYTQVRPNIRL